jgi:hypothetical protein
VWSPSGQRQAITSSRTISFALSLHLHTSYDVPSSYILRSGLFFPRDCTEILQGPPSGICDNSAQLHWRGAPTDLCKDSPKLALCHYLSLSLSPHFSGAAPSPSLPPSPLQHQPLLLCKLKIVFPSPKTPTKKFRHFSFWNEKSPLPPQSRLPCI